MIPDVRGSYKVAVQDQANELGIHVGISPDNYGGGLGFGDERVVRFTFPEKTVSEELAKKLIGEGPDSDEDGGACR